MVFTPAKLAPPRRLRGPGVAFADTDLLRVCSMLAMLAPPPSAIAHRAVAVEEGKQVLVDHVRLLLHHLVPRLQAHITHARTQTHMHVAWPGEASVKPHPQQCEPYCTR